MRFVRIFSVALAILMLGSGCWGSRPARPDGEGVPKLVGLDPPPSVPGTGTPVQEIRFGPPVPIPVLAYSVHTEDVLEVSIMGESDMTRRVTVLPGSGTISYAGEYNIRAAGRTEQEIAEDLQSRLTKFYVSPRVSVRVLEATGNAATIFGVVRRPGLVRVKNDSTITGAIAMAGGILPGVGETGTTEFELADLSGAWLRRGNGYVDVDFVKLFRGTREEQLAHDVRVFPGDKLYIPSSVSLSNKIFILGQVNAPKVIRYRGDIRFIEALAEANIRPKGARWNGIALVRNGLSENRECRVVNAAAIVRGRRPDFRLQPGDIIYVPRTPFQTVVDVTSDLNSIFSSVRSADTLWTNTRFDRP